MASVGSIIESEPVRTKLYPILLLVVAYLATKGLIDSDTVNRIGAVAALVVGSVGIEKARSAVTPVI